MVKVGIIKTLEMEVQAKHIALWDTVFHVVLQTVYFDKCSVLCILTNADMLDQKQNNIYTKITREFEKLA